MIALGSCTRNHPVSQSQNDQMKYTPPPWAPIYENVNQVSYYYLPDIECYYDVSSQDFIYLQNGNWMFASQLPSSYLWNDLNNPYVVLLDNNVYQPWMHHQFYVSNYPRYYYYSTFRDTYNDLNSPLHGFNENSRTPIYKSRGSINNVQRIQISNTQRVDQTKPMQTSKYYGKNIGKPVKVLPQMKKTSQRKNTTVKTKNN